MAYTGTYIAIALQMALIFQPTTDILTIANSLPFPPYAPLPHPLSNGSAISHSKFIGIILYGIGLRGLILTKHFILYDYYDSGIWMQWHSELGVLGQKHPIANPLSPFSETRTPFARRTKYWSGLAWALCSDE